MLKIKNLSKNYGKKEVLHQLNIEMSYGVYALLGPNGAGKSTLLNILAQVIPASSGEVSYNEVLIFNNKDYFSKLGYLPQSPSFYSNYNAKEILSYLGYLKGMKKKEIKKMISPLLEAVNLEDVGRKHISAYSGGMRQRLGIAQSLLNDPEILILDEPTAGLDPKERMRFRNLIASLGKNKIIIIATHIVSDIESIADEILLFNDGKVIHRGTVDELCMSINGKVFDFITSSDDGLHLFNVSNLSYHEAKYHVRVIGEKPNFDAVKEGKANLEDVYLYYFGRNHNETSI